MTHLFSVRLFHTHTQTCAHMQMLTHSSTHTSTYSMYRYTYKHIQRDAHTDSHVHSVHRHITHKGSHTQRHTLRYTQIITHSYRCAYRDALEYTPRHTLTLTFMYTTLTLIHTALHTQVDSSSHTGTCPQRGALTGTHTKSTHTHAHTLTRRHTITHRPLAPFRGHSIPLPYPCALQDPPSASAPTLGSLGFGSWSSLPTRLPAPAGQRLSSVCLSVRPGVSSLAPSSLQINYRIILMTI